MGRWDSRRTLGFALALIVLAGWASLGNAAGGVPPPAPDLNATAPASPANNNSPKITGFSIAGTTVRVYATDHCSGPVVAQGGAAKLASPGIAVSVTNDSTTDFSATASDASDTSNCSDPITYVEDSTPADSQVDSGPDGPTNDSTPTFAFSANETAVTFRCHFDAASFAKCSGPGNTHTPSAAMSNGNHTFYVRATDAAGNVEPVAATRSFTVDTIPPTRPVLNALVSPANDNVPEITGSAQADAHIDLYAKYANRDCAGPVVSQGSTADLASPGISASVPDDTTTRFAIRATDAAGNVSICSKPITYVEDSTPPETAISSGPSGTTVDPQVKFGFGVNEPGTFTCALDDQTSAPCSSPIAYTGLERGVEHVFQVFATDLAGNADATPAQSTFTLPVNVPPNILLIVTDDQRLAGTMSYMPRTLDIFGSGGATFDRAFVTTPLCCPSRASIFSGKYAHNHGIVINDGTGFDANQTWQRYLHDAGYYTGILGTYLLHVSTPSAPHFDYTANWSYSNENDPRIMETRAETFLDLAEADDSLPWALVAAVHSPHKPWNVEPVSATPIAPYDNPPPSFGETDLSDKHPAVAASAEDWSRNASKSARTAQLKELQATDESIGKLFNALEAREENQNTLAIFLSDNGYLWGEHKLDGKNRPYMESVQVPLYMRWPGHVTPGSVSEDLVANIDVAPTIFEATGLTPGYTIDGRSLLSPSLRPWLLLEGPAGESSGPPSWLSYVTQTRQYIDWPNGFSEDYDLTADPYELQASNADDLTVEAQITLAQSCAGENCP